MSKKQSRRSISIRGTTYDRVSAYCDKHDISRSKFFEDRVIEFLGSVEAAEEDDDEAPISAQEQESPVAQEDDAITLEKEVSAPTIKDQDTPSFLQPHPEPVTFRPDVSDADEFGGGYREF